MVGQFKDGHGEFYGQETFKGRQVLVREVYSPLDSKRRHLEIAYSADGGRSWETNWSMVDTLVSAACSHSLDAAKLIAPRGEGSSARPMAAPHCTTP
jgi:hypothetical protein